MEITDELEQYAEDHSTDESDVLKKIYRETYLKVPYPQMISGKMQGGLLSMISNMVKPEKILEIGTFTAYSTIYLAGGLAENGVLHTIDINAELEEMIHANLAAAGVAGRVQLHVGDALEIIPQLKGPFDLAFIDADKEHYPDYYRLVIEKVRKGGIIIADNCLWGGKVLKKNKPSDVETKGIQEFNSIVQNDAGVENLLLPVRDGMMVIRKK